MYRGGDLEMPPKYTPCTLKHVVLPVLSVSKMLHNTRKCFPFLGYNILTIKLREIGLLILNKL